MTGRLLAYVVLNVQHYAMFKHEGNVGLMQYPGRAVLRSLDLADSSYIESEGKSHCL